MRFETTLYPDANVRLGRNSSLCVCVCVRADIMYVHGYVQGFVFRGRGVLAGPNQGRPVSEIPPVCPLALSCYVISTGARGNVPCARGACGGIRPQSRLTLIGMIRVSETPVYARLLDL